MKRLKGKADERKKRSDQSGKENCLLVTTPFVDATLSSYRSKLRCTKGKMGQFIVKVLI